MGAVAVIGEHIRCDDENPKPFAWTRGAEDIIDRLLIVEPLSKHCAGS